MSPQLLWTIAGLILTVLTLGAVSISTFQSTDSAQVKLLAAEVGNVRVAAKMWAANEGAAATPTTDALQKYIPELNYINAVDLFQSKALPDFLINFSAADDPAICGAGKVAYQIVVNSSAEGWATYAPGIKAALGKESCTGSVLEGAVGSKDPSIRAGTIFFTF